jgi:Protein of unknown function with HXXEE motif
LRDIFRDKCSSIDGVRDCYTCAAYIGGCMKTSFKNLLWLMPGSFALHIADEWFNDFTGYVVREMHGDAMPHRQFLLNNAIFMTIMLCLSAWAARSRSRASAFLLMSWASGNLFWDFLVHLFYTVHTSVYSPGLITATLLYYPVTFIVTAAGIRDGRLSVASSIGAFAIGGALMAFVLWAGVYHFAT